MTGAATRPTGPTSGARQTVGDRGGGERQTDRRCDRESEPHRVDEHRVHQHQHEHGHRQRTQAIERTTRRRCHERDHGHGRRPQDRGLGPGHQDEGRHDGAASQPTPTQRQPAQDGADGHDRQSDVLAGQPCRRRCLRSEVWQIRSALGLMEVEGDLLSSFIVHFDLLNRVD
jgi:hypothetical protein